MTPQPITAQKTSRLDWLDAFRGLAVLWMIAAHCLNTFLAAEYTQTAWFTVLNYTDGLVAPSFLFIAGFVQGLASRKGWQNPKPLLPRLRRLSTILLLGYALQFPWGALFGASPDLAGKIFSSLCRVDVLHCLAISLVIILFIARLTNDARRFDFFCLSLSFGCVIASPFVWKWSPPFVPGPIISWLNAQAGALFPLFPWFAFVGLGAVCSRWLNRRYLFLILVPICWSGAWLLTHGLPHWLGTIDYTTRPDFFAQRLGWLFLICFLFLSVPRLTKIPVLNFAGQHSLTLYVLHLQIIYGGLGLASSLASRLRGNQSLLSVALLFVLVAGLSLLIIQCMVCLSRSTWYQTLLSRYENRHRN